MSAYCLSIALNADVDTCWSTLEADGWTLLYSEETTTSCQIYGIAPAAGTYQLPPEIIALIPWQQPSVDWEEQWRDHGLAYASGYVHVDLALYSSSLAVPPSLKLQPGAGFGDLSHPTTRLALHLMAPIVVGKPCVDVGCGSGILALAACAWGAAPVVGLDIDTDAVAHATVNAWHNGLSEQVSFTDSPTFAATFYSPETVVVMNMISSEQEVAWESLGRLRTTCSTLIVTGIYLGEEDSYLAHWQQRGWRLCRQCAEESWYAFHLVR